MVARDPDPAEIRRRAVEIRAGWTRHQEELHRVPQLEDLANVLGIRRRPPEIHPER